MSKKIKKSKTATGLKEIEAVLDKDISRCRVCGSTNRSAYTNMRSLNHNGYTMIWQTCKCEACGQSRVDRSII